MIHEDAGFVTGDTKNGALVELKQRISSAWAELSPAERAVCRVLSATSAELLLYATAAELGARSGTSNATVVRTLQSLGYSGLSAVKQQIAGSVTTAVAPDVRLGQRLAHLGGDVETIHDEVWTEVRSLVDLSEQANTPDRFARAVEMILSAGAVYCYGLGLSSSAARYLTTRLRRVGIAATQLDTDGFRLADELLILQARDVVILIAPGRHTRDIAAISLHARDVDAAVVVITDHIEEKLKFPPEVVLRAPLTPTGLVSEALGPMIISDVLVHSLAAVTPEGAMRTSQKLSEIRRLLGY